MGHLKDQRMSRFTKPYAQKTGCRVQTKKRSENAQPQNEILCSKGVWGLPSTSRRQEM